MPKYYFHYRTDDGVVRDDNGHELDDLDAAERRAAEMGQAIIGRALGDGDDPKAPRSIEITDEGGEELLYVVFWASPEPVEKGKAGTVVEPVTLH
ncbi:DUF6894 family protein [uncultured Devosia sp.]|uniref:DUF6894 family protein n=1 Tax=uncultured Devosia sp. TaxID=211434 RepID=UPI0035CBCCCE